MKLKSRARLTVLMMLITFGLSGCGGGGATMEARSTTTGQELMDLDKAYKEGIISEKEYEKKKKEIMNRK